MTETAYIKCPNCGNEEFVVPENLDEANLYYTCSSCSHEYEVGFFDVCPSCNKPVGFYEGGAFKKDMLALGKIALNTALNPASYLGVLKDYAGMAVNNFTGNLIDGNGDGVCPYCQKRYVRCGVCHELTPIDPNLTFKDSFICSSCGRTVAPNGVRPGCGIKHSKAFKQLRISNPMAHEVERIPYEESNTNTYTLQPLKIEILDNKEYYRSQELLKIFADCLGVPSVEKSSIIRADQVTTLRENLAKWYNISISSNLSQFVSELNPSFACLAGLIIDKSKKPKARQTEKKNNTLQPLKIEILDNKEYNRPHDLLKIFADCLYVSASSVDLNSKISNAHVGVKTLRKNLVNWYNISISSNISQYEEMTFSNLASLIISESRKNNKAKQIESKNYTPSLQPSKNTEEKNNTFVENQSTMQQYNDAPSNQQASYQPDPQGKRKLPFKMEVEQVFEIKGRGHIATGIIETGFVKEDDFLCVNGDTKHPIRFIAAEMFRKLLPYAEFDDNVGLLVDLCGHIIAPGDVLTKLGEQNTANEEIDKSPVQTEPINEKEHEYLEELKECLANGSISDGERRLLNKIRSKLGISEERAAELEQSLLTPHLTEDEQEYLDAFKDAMVDGTISDAERRLLDKIKKYNNISDERAAEIEKML